MQLNTDSYLSSSALCLNPLFNSFIPPLSSISAVLLLLSIYLHPSIRNSFLWRPELLKPRLAPLDCFPAPGVLRPCHSRLMPCSQTDQLPLVLNLPLLWHGWNRQVMPSWHIAKMACLARETVIHTFNLPDSVTVWRCCRIGFDSLRGEESGWAGGNQAKWLFMKKEMVRSLPVWFNCNAT